MRGDTLSRATVEIQGGPAAPVVADYSTIEPVRCPCGWARRAFADVPDAPASVHRVEVEVDARTHYHREHTEIYYILECAAGAAIGTHYHREHPEIYYILECAAGAAIELDGQRVTVGAGHAVMIPPGVRHRAVGRMTILNVVVPPFDPADEWFD
jgi:mannose-6-phosphate isomerase-like protein (cupin superfamily)